MLKKWFGLLLIALPIMGYAAKSYWVDLTHVFSAETLYWPTAKSFQLETVFDGMTPLNFYYSAKQFSAAEHGGTHLDAPSHFAKGKQSVAEIPISHLMGKAVIIDVRKQAIPDDDYLISIADIKSWEKDYGEIPKRSIVLFYTGYSKYWPNKFAYLGTTLAGEEAIHTLHFPGLAKDTAEWLIKNRQIKAVGIDTASIDYGQTIRFPTHQVLAQHNIPIFENVAHLNEVHSPFAEVVALPMKIKDGTGAPLRIIAKAIPYQATPAKMET
ncbi:MAG: cyclase [Legionellales bacterium]|nr:cyclase [Legionellales bacterium]